MKKLILNVLFILSLISNSQAQGVVFVYSDLNSAELDAQTADKLIFLDVYADWCGPCKAMENSIFTNPEVGKEFNQNFLNLKVQSDTDIGKSMALKYGIKEYPTYLFLNQEGEIVYKIIGFHSAVKLLAEADKAKRNYKNFIPIKSLDEAFVNGKNEPDFLYEYLKRKSFEQGSQPKILDRYLEVVPESELKTEKVLSLISDNVTSVSSKGFTILSESLSRFMSMTESQQKAILRGITNSKRMTFQQAVKEKNDELFDILIDAVHATSYSRQAAFAEERQFRYDYAKHTQNFKHFKIIAQEEAGQIVSRTPEDFENQTALTIEEFKRSAEEKGISTSSGRYKMMLNGLENGAAKSASFQLNEFAWGYYQMATDEEDLRTAIKWSAYSIKLFENPANWETYSLLLKKVGRTKDAKKALKQALKLAKKSGLDSKSVQQIY